jgi:hypothetical protein
VAQAAAVRKRGVWFVSLEINEMNLARLLFPWARESAKTTCVQTDRRMLRLKNYVALTEEIDTRQGRVIDAPYYVTSIRVQDTFRFVNLEEAEACFDNEVRQVMLLPQYRSFVEAQGCHQAALNANDKSQKTYWALMATWQELVAQSARAENQIGSQSAEL